MSLKMLKNDGSPVQLALPDLDSPSLYTKEIANKRAHLIISKFDKSHKTESAFYLTFCRLDLNDIAFLKAYWHVESDWEVFKRLCRLYKIKIA